MRNRLQGGNQKEFILDLAKPLEEEELQKIDSARSCGGLGTLELRSTMRTRFKEKNATWAKWELGLM